MHVSIRLPQANPFQDLERSVFAFTSRLGHYCGAIAACAVAIDGSMDDSSRQSALTVKVRLTVFGEDVRVVANASAPRRDGALAEALDDAFDQTRARLDGIARDRSNCGCWRDPAACAATQRKPA